MSSDNDKDEKKVEVRVSGFGIGFGIVLGAVFCWLLIFVIWPAVFRWVGNEMRAQGTLAPAGYQQTRNPNADIEVPGFHVRREKY